MSVTFFQKTNLSYFFKDFGRSVLDYCIFHDCAQFTEWDIDRTLNFFPPEGQFSLLRYSISDKFTPPFRLFSYLEEPGKSQIDILLRVTSEFPDTVKGKKVIITLPLPKATVRYNKNSSK